MKKAVLQLQAGNRTITQATKLIEDYVKVFRVRDPLKGTQQQLGLSKTQHVAQRFINLDPATIRRHQTRSGGMIKSAAKEFFAFAEFVNMSFSLLGHQT